MYSLKDIPFCTIDYNKPNFCSAIFQFTNQLCGRDKKNRQPPNSRNIIKPISSLAR